MNTAGLLTVRARIKGAQLAGLSVQLDRPAISRLLIGKQPKDVLGLIPKLYALCPMAQHAAAQLALSAAENHPHDPHIENAALWLEYLHESLWRIFLDWPPALGSEPEKDAFIAWRQSRSTQNISPGIYEGIDQTLTKLTQDCLKNLGAEEMAPLALSAISPPDARNMGRLMPEVWLEKCQNNPTAAGINPPVTEQTVSALFCKRVFATRWAMQQFLSKAPYPLAKASGGGWGIGQTLTARGLLTHAVKLENGTVREYQIWAPTDLLFADARALTGLLAEYAFPSMEEARHIIGLAVLALDPCLPFVVELENA